MCTEDTRAVGWRDMLKRCSLVFAALSCGLGFAAGCGTTATGQQGDAPTAQILARSTRSAATARFSVEVSNDNAEAGGPGSRSDGVFDFASLNGLLNEQPDASGGYGKSVTLYGESAFVPMAGVKGIAKDDPCYGKKWGVFDYSSSASASQDGGPGSRLSPVPFDPADVVESLENREATLTDVGTEQVQGFETTHYRVSVDSKRLDQRFVSDVWDARALQSFDVWADRSQRLVRARWVLTIRWGSARVSPSSVVPDVLGIGGTYDQTTTVTLWDYGVSVEVRKPPTDQTCDFPSLFQRTMNTFDRP